MPRSPEIVDALTEQRKTRRGTEVVIARPGSGKGPRLRRGPFLDPEGLSDPDVKELATEVAGLQVAVPERTPHPEVELEPPRPVRQLQNHLPKAQKEKVAEAYRSGMPVKQIMAEFNIARTTVDRIARRHQAPTRKVPALDESQIDKAAQLYETGLSLAKVAKELESSPNTVRAALLRRSVTLRPRSGR